MEDSEQKPHHFHRHQGNILVGLLVIAVGVLFLLQNLGFTQLGFDKLWPVVLIIIGAYLLLTPKRH